MQVNFPVRLSLCLIGLFHFFLVTQMFVSMPAADAEDFVATYRLSGGQIVDPSTHNIEMRDICIKGEKIVTCGPQVEGEKVIPLAGRYIVPGFIDAHVHAWGNVSLGNNANGYLGYDRVAGLALRAGVVGMLDLFGAEDEMFAARERIRERGAAEPTAELFVAGPCLTAPGGHCSEYGIPTRTIGSPAEAEAAVTALSAKHPDVVKVVYDHSYYLPTISKETLGAVLSTAAKRDIKTMVHVGTWQDVADAIDSGATAVTHLPAGVMPTEILTKAKTHGTVFIPTIVVQQEFSRMVSDPTLLSDPLLAALVEPVIIDNYKLAVANAKSDKDLSRFVSFQEPHLSSDYENIRLLAQAGVTIAAGTDAGNVGVFQGYSLHRELEHFSLAGLSAWQILEAATIVPAKFLGRQSCLQSGCEANLVVLQSSPLEDIRNTKSVVATFARGKGVSEFYKTSPFGGDTSRR